MENRGDRTHGLHVKFAELTAKNIHEAGLKFLAGTGSTAAAAVSDTHLILHQGGR